MAALIPIRDELMRGDLRALYLGWLASFPAREWDAGGIEEDELEPPVPPGLKRLSEPLRALADFLRVDENLLDAAAAASKGEAAEGPSREETERWVATLPDADKNAYLARLLSSDGDGLVRAELTRKFREATPRRVRRDDARRRTVAQLVAARDALAGERARRSAEEEAREQASRAREQAEAKAKQLDALARREPAAWLEVEQLIVTKRPGNYDQAIALLVDLKEIATNSGRAREFATRTRELRERHANKPSLLRRFIENKLES